MQLGPGVAVAKVGSCSSDVTPSLGTSVCLRCSPTKEKKKKINILLKSSVRGELMCRSQTII